MRWLNLYRQLTKEPLIKSIMNRVADKKWMIARSTTQRVPIFVATHKGIGIAGGLRCQAPSEGNNHSRRHLSCIPSRKAECAAMRDLIRGSLTENST